MRRKDLRVFVPNNVQIHGIVSEAQPGLSDTFRLVFTSISDTTLNIAILPANAARRSARILNGSDLRIPLAEDAVASWGNYTKILEPGEEYNLEFPASVVALNGYFSRIPEGAIFVTERT